MHHALADYPFTRFSEQLQHRFGERVGKVCIDAGFTCPNRDGRKARGGCHFCEQGGARASHAEPDLPIRQQVRCQIESVMDRSGSPRKFIAYFQAFSNTYAPLEILRRCYDAALDDEHVVGLMVGTRADCVGSPVCHLLSSYLPRGPVWVELGLQTVNQATLDRMNRQERVEDFAEACGSAREAGLDVTAHVIFGLPGDDRETNLRTVAYAAACGATGIKIHNLYVDDRSAIAEGWRRGGIVLPSLEEYVSLVCDALEILPAHIVIHRLTGQAPPAHHLAPAWATNKLDVQRRVVEEMRRRGTTQGCRARSDYDY